MSVSQMVSDLKQHLEHGAEFVASHIPALVEWAAKVESEPLVEWAIGTTLGPTAKSLLLEMGQRMEAQAQEFEAAKAQAVADAVAAAQAPPAEPAADPAAEPPAA